MSGKSAVYESMHREQELCDAVIRVCGVEFTVHKMILCNCSTYFRALFTHWSSPDERYYDLSHVTPEIMRLIVEFAYTDVLRITEQNVQDLFTAADFYDIKGMVKLCCRFMLEHLTPRNCIGVMALAAQYYSKDLLPQVVFFTLRHFEEVCTTSQEFLELSENCLSEIIESNHLNVKQEKTVLEAVFRWIAHKPGKRQECMPRLLPKVRLPFITTEQLGNIMMENDLAQKNKDLILSMTADPSSIASGSSQPPVLPRFPPAILLAMGGWSGSGPKNIFEAYDVRTNRWVLVPSEMTPRAYHNVACLNGSIYCVGGFDGRAHFNALHRFDLVRKTWHKMASMDFPRCYVSVTMLDNHIYALGGYDGVNRLKTAERYSPKYNQWVEIAPMHMRRSDASCTTLNGKIYICGGFTGSDCLLSAEVYDPQTNQWTLIEDMNSRRSGVGVISYQDNIFAVGGFNGARRLETVEAYDPNTNTWSVMPPMLTPRSNFGIAVLDDRLYAVGGFNGSRTENKVECFDAQTGVWSEASKLGVRRSALSCIVIDGPPEIIEAFASRISLPTPPEGAPIDVAEPSL